MIQQILSADTHPTWPHMRINPHVSDMAAYAWPSLVLTLKLPLLSWKNEKKSPGLLNSSFELILTCESEMVEMLQSYWQVPPNYPECWTDSNFEDMCCTFTFPLRCRGVSWPLKWLEAVGSLLSGLSITISNKTVKSRFMRGVSYTICNNVVTFR